MICQHCGATISDGNHFCIYCGRSQEGNATSPVQQTIRPIKLNLAKLLGDTFTLYFRHFGIMCLSGLIYVGIPSIFEVYGIVTEKPNLFSAFERLIECYVSIWIIRQCLYTARGGTGFQCDRVFPSFVMFLKMFALNFIVGFSAIICALPVAILVAISVLGDLPLAVNVVIIASAVCAAILPCYVLTRLWLAMFFLVDRNMGVMDSVSDAWQASSGNFWKLFTGTIVFVVCIYCGLFGFAVAASAFAEDGSVLETLIINMGLVPTYPILWIGLGLAYLQLTGEPHYLDRDIENHALEVKNLDV